MAITFDTLEVVEELKSSGFTDAQARGISVALKVVQESSLKELVTKSDLKEEIAKLSERITQVESRLSERMTKLEGKIDAIKGDLEGKINLLKGDLEGKINLLKGDLEGKINLLKWMLGILLAGVLSLVMKAFFIA